MKVLFCRWDSVCEQMVFDAMRKLNIQFDIFEHVIRSTDYDKEYLYGVEEMLEKEHYDYVFSVNFLPVISKLCKIYRVKYICQTVDCPSLQLYSRALEHPYNYVFCFDWCQYEKFAPVNPDHIFYMPLGCDYIYLSTITVTEEDHKKYDCDISFIGSTYSHKCAYNTLPYVPEYFQGYIDGLIHAQMNLYGYNLIEDSLTDEFCKEFKNYAWTFFPEDHVEDVKGLIADHYIGEKCTEQERIRTLQNISEHFAMDIYTKDDISMIPKINNRGGAHTYIITPKIYKCSKINLNMTNRPIKSGIPQRIFDIMGSGGFVLTNYQPELEQYFEIGKELAVYESQSDLLEKIAYYLGHEDERREIAANGEAAMWERHQYDMRLREMFQIVGEDI